MCGRYRIRKADLAAMGLRISPSPGFDEFDEKPRWNVAPSHHVPIIRMNDAGVSELAMVRWGLIPAWATDVPKSQPINARAETVATSGMFKRSFLRHRCLVLADGFYEWRRTATAKQPMLIHRHDDAAFCFAGIWERWHPVDAEPVETMAIITTEPNSLMRPIHNRMPVILQAEDYARWIDPAISGGDAQAMLKPYGDFDFEAYPVSTHVNSPRNDTAACAERVEASEGGHLWA